MSPLNNGAMRMPPQVMRPPVIPRFGRAPPPPPPPPGMNSRPGMLPPPMPRFVPNRGRPMPPPGRSGMMVGPPPPNMYGPPPQMPPMCRPMPGHIPPPPPMMRGPMGLRAPMPMRPPRGMMPPHVLPHMRPRYPPNNANGKPKQNGNGPNNNNKKNHKFEELEMKKPWMTDEIRSEIQKKNKLYAKAKKNKDAKEWEEFKDLRNKVTRMIRDAKNEYLSKHPEQAHLYENDEEYGAHNSEVMPDTSDSEDDTETQMQPDEGSEQKFSQSSREENLFCEVCDRDFNNAAQMRKHLNEHQTCGIDGCDFRAHPKLVEKHISMQHATGLYQRMKSIIVDKDVEKWIAERKKNRYKFPTESNIQEKEAEKLEKKNRGEVIELSNHKKSHEKKQPNKNPNLQKRQRKRNRKPRDEFQLPKIIEAERYRGLLPFAGINMLDDSSHDAETYEHDSTEKNIDEIESPVTDQLENEQFRVSDDDDEVVPAKIIKLTEVPKISENVVIEKPKVTKSLGLVADYGTESDDDELPEEVPIVKLNIENEISHISESENKVIGVIQKNDDSALEELSTSPNVSTKNNSSKNSNASEEVTQPKSNEKSYQKKETKNSNFKNHKANDSEYSNGRLRLLNRLLQSEIQHERNLIFQCITFIANNNFFE
ncbi:uncharacterized protein PFB0765w-like isoform X2 [Trichogramma pretiosum]|uniref:uncharacterized protein PFB0765w-like isoform X2 n=1 Tax=Trichogramma pretiosum TaxID=7493 RepID=UPI0006C99154|nr:uncharacterized protein PFB0765w-like isoform X2 [Trichogramma pretiosum]